jgi:hypothetical protein
VCRVFFEGFYSTLLPKKQVAGISLATAIMAGARSCRARFTRAGARLGRGIPEIHWTETVDSFVLFGDPSMSLQLR